MNEEKKVKALRTELRNLGSVLIAFSGGVDSTFLLKVARDELGDRVLAVTAVSPTYPRHELEEAKTLARTIGVRHLLIKSGELDLPGYRDNPPDRCYHCKKALFARLRKLAKQSGFEAVCDGTNADDAKDYRPGRRAAEELGVSSPLARCGLNKEEIRRASRKLGLPTWDKPAFACLASRFPYGEKISAARLKQVDQAEIVVRKFVGGQCRVRHHGAVARIEVEPASLSTVIRHRQEIVAGIKKSGFSYVALDLEGYRTGSMNEILNFFRGEARKK